jgi:hypothetical protein
MLIITADNKAISLPFNFAPAPLPKDIPDGAHGVIIEHRPAPETYGGVAVETAIGSFAVVKKHQKQAAEKIGESVRVRQVDHCYKAVEILDFNE